VLLHMPATQTAQRLLWLRPGLWQQSERSFGSNSATAATHLHLHLHLLLPGLAAGTVETGPQRKASLHLQQLLLLQRRQHFQTLA
jgi:hypothetical protein